MQALALHDSGRVLHIRVFDSVGTWLVNRMFDYDAFPLFVGRDRQCQIHVDAPFVSRWHARVDRDRDCVLITDLGSKAGTFVFGEPMMGRLIPNRPRELPGTFNTFGLADRHGFCPIHISFWHHHRDRLPTDPQQLIEIPPAPPYNPFTSDRSRTP